MESELEARQEAEWQVLYDRVAALLERYGKIDFSSGADYWLVDENLGWWCQIIETHKTTVLNPAIIEQLQDFLQDYADWRIEIHVVLDQQENPAPPMGLIINKDKIIDDLQRDFLPPEFRDLTYPGSMTSEQWAESRLPPSLKSAR